VHGSLSGRVCSSKCPAAKGTLVARASMDENCKYCNCTWCAPQNTTCPNSFKICKDLKCATCRRKVPGCKCPVCKATRNDGHFVLYTEENVWAKQDLDRGPCTPCPRNPAHAGGAVFGGAGVHSPDLPKQTGEGQRSDYGFQPSGFEDSEAGAGAGGQMAQGSGAASQKRKKCDDFEGRICDLEDFKKKMQEEYPFLLAAALQQHASQTQPAQSSATPPELMPSGGSAGGSLEPLFDSWEGVDAHLMFTQDSEGSDYAEYEQLLRQDQADVTQPGTVLFFICDAAPADEGGGSSSAAPSTVQRLRVTPDLTGITSDQIIAVSAATFQAALVGNSACQEPRAAVCYIGHVPVRVVGEAQVGWIVYALPDDFSTQAGAMAARAVKDAKDVPSGAWRIGTVRKGSNPMDITEVRNVECQIILDFCKDGELNRLRKLEQRVDDHDKQLEVQGKQLEDLGEQVHGHKHRLGILEGAATRQRGQQGVLKNPSMPCMPANHVERVDHSTNKPLVVMMRDSLVGSGNKAGSGLAVATAAGLGGVGKTTLARHYVLKYHDHYPYAIWWVNAEKREDVEASFARLAKHIFDDNDFCGGKEPAESIDDRLSGVRLN